MTAYGSKTDICHVKDTPIVQSCLSRGKDRFYKIFRHLIGKMGEFRTMRVPGQLNRRAVSLELLPAFAAHFEMKFEHKFLPLG